MDKGAQNQPPEPQKPRAKHYAWKAGLYLTPFLYAAVLTKWGNDFSASLIIAMGCVVVGLFLAAGLLHLRDIGGRRWLRENFHTHPVPYVLAIVVVCCVVLGTSVYLAVRPPLQHIAKAPPNPNPVLNPPANNPPSAITPTAKPHNKPPATPSAQPSPATPAIPPAESAAQPTYGQQTCVGNACAQGPGSQATLNQYGAPKLVMTDGQQDAISDAMRPFSGSKIDVTANTPTEDSMVYANRLGVALQRAGLVAPVQGAMIMPPQGEVIPAGISMVVDPARFNEASILALSMLNSGLISYKVPVQKGGLGVLEVIISPNR